MFAEDIKKLVKENTNFRKVLVTGKHSQIVVMSIPVGGDAPAEHADGTIHKTKEDAEKSEKVEI